jgi:F-type H+-transporting ATPase subunit epsilon
VRLKVLLPTGVLVDQEVSKVTAEAENGGFCLLPRHIDFVAALVPGLLSFTTIDGQEEFAAVGEGVLVKCGAEVLVSTRHAALGPDLGALRDAVERQFRMLDEHEQLTRSALAKLEASFVRRFLEIGKQGHG